MMNGKCKCKGKGGLCPISFGLAWAITYGLAIFLMSAAVIMGFAPPELAALKPHITWSVAFIHLLWALLEGFVFGLVLALLYDCFACCFAKCCKNSEGTCGCNSPEREPDIK